VSCIQSGAPVDRQLRSCDVTLCAGSESAFHHCVAAKDVAIASLVY